MDDFDISWLISSTENSSISWTANTMDYVFESDETDPKITIAVTV